MIQGHTLIVNDFRLKKREKKQNLRGFAVIGGYLTKLSRSPFCPLP